MPPPPATLASARLGTMNGTSPHSKPGIARRMLVRLRLLRMKLIRGKPAPAWFAEFVDGRLDLVEDGKTAFSIPLADIVAVGESTNADGPWSDDHFLVVRYREAGEEKELELPFNERSGVGDACAGLLRALGAPPVLPLLNCTHPASVFLWPPDKAGSPVWPDYGPTHSVGSGRDFARWRREHDRTSIASAPSPCRRWLRRLACLALAGVLFILVCNLAVLVAAAGRVTPVGRAAEAPARRAAVVMGCVPKLRGGWDNPYFTARIEAAAELWRAGKVEALIVSGDNHVEWYDEPSEMKAALVAAGVPEDRVVCDYAGFRTLDSVVRARTIFGLDSFLVVSQDFHVRRAIFLGRCKGLDVRGYAARGVPFGRLSSRTIVREPLARVAAVLDVLLGRRPRFGGPHVPLPQTAPSL